MSYTYKNPNKKTTTNAQKPWAPQPERPVTTKSRKEKFLDNMETTRNGWYSNVKVSPLPMNMTYTENGAVAYKTSGSALVDINYQLTAMRTMPDSEVVKMFRKAYSENPRLAMRWLFKAADIREGDGERRLFKVCMTDMMNNGGAEMVANLISLMPEFNRWDMLYTFINNKTVYPAIARTFRKQWAEDMKNMEAGKSISLMAKWLKSSNSHNPDTRRYGLQTARILNLSERDYRKALSAMRKHLDVVERKMSSQNWQSIDYETVPSKANLIYNKAFLKNDEARRRTYLDALTKGDAKINSSVAYPHEIVHKYCTGTWRGVRAVDAALEGMWKALPNLVKDDSTTLVVADGSSSMCSDVGGSVTALEVANALAIYFAERAKGAYHNRYITFSMTPKFVTFQNGSTLNAKIKTAQQHCEIANTNISAVFDLILETAIKTNAPQSDLPKNLLIITDGHFDYMVSAGNGRSKVSKTLMQEISKKYKDAGYTMPNLIFWNVCGGGRSGSMPLSADERGIMVSGFSVNTLKMLMTGKTNPYEVLVEALMDKRYDIVEETAFQ